MKNFGLKDTVIPTLSLLCSSCTLVCCALPALFIMLGAGATLAGLIGSFPQLIWLSAHKTIIFPMAAIMLTFAGVMQWRTKNLPCPADPLQAKACKRLRRVSLGIYCFSLLAFLTGAFFAFVAPYILV